MARWTAGRLRCPSVSSWCRCPVCVPWQGLFSCRLLEPLTWVGTLECTAPEECMLPCFLSCCSCAAVFACMRGRLPRSLCFENRVWTEVGSLCALPSGVVMLSRVSRGLKAFWQVLHCYDSVATIAHSVRAQCSMAAPIPALLACWALTPQCPCQLAESPTPHPAKACSAQDACAHVNHHS